MVLVVGQVVESFEKGLFSQRQVVLDLDLDLAIW
jgi:hypothetical protein